MGRKKKEEVKQAVEVEFNEIFEPLFSDNLDDPRYYQVYGGRGCFLGSQEIMTEKGAKNISDIKVGDTVKSFNVETKKIENKKVLNTFKYKHHKEYLNIKMKDGTVIKCTKDHKFFYKGEWVEIWEILKTLKVMKS